MQLIALQSSPLLARLRWAAAGVTVITAVLLLANGEAVAALGALLAAAGALHTPIAVGHLGLRDDGVCEWFEGPGVEGQAGLEMGLDGSFSAAGWLVLRLARPGRQRGRLLVLAPDSAPADQLRHLRVWLKWAAPHAELNSGSRRWSE